ncbi:hypothetical protein [Candidatus Soleaferrea massiliensis]|uniref:hypothetical protein n=1 Tax=Candidatus Soleaferrea massiliensis TaxID=1470354 RepID=UPI00058D19CF|nr:hypothetical protein [Candidatus Soleaferrea massiliensis]
MKKYVCRLALVLMAVLLSCLLSACTNDPSKLETYDFGGDKVSSITSVVGERTVTDVASEGKNEFPSKQYTYQSSSVSDDLLQYTQFLQEQGWTAAGNGYNLKELPGSAQFVKESVDEGQILTLYIAYENNQYAIKVTKLEAVIGQS